MISSGKAHMTHHFVSPFDEGYPVPLDAERGKRLLGLKGGLVEEAMQASVHLVLSLDKPDLPRTQQSNILGPDIPSPGWQTHSSNSSP